jgi:hypothetical protein
MWAILSFWGRQHSTIEKLFGQNAKGAAAVTLKFAQANIPLIKKLWPQYNENGLLDDLLGTLEAVLAPPPQT